MLESGYTAKRHRRMIDDDILQGCIFGGAVALHAFQITLSTSFV